MKHLITILVVFLNTIVAGKAQSYFNIRGTFHSYANILNGVVETGNNFYLKGIAVDSSNSFVNFGLKFIKIDWYGNIVVDTIYQPPSMQTLSRDRQILPYTDSGFIISTSYLDTMWGAAILFADTAGHITNRMNYTCPFASSSDEWHLIDFERGNNGEWLCLSQINYAYQSDITLMKLDSTFGVVWIKSYGLPFWDDYPKRLLVEPDGYLIANGVTNANILPNGGQDSNAKFASVLYKLDTAGQVQWHWMSDLADYESPIDDIVPLPGGGYIYACRGKGYRDMTPGPINPLSGYPMVGVVRRLDAGRNMVWELVTDTCYSSWASNGIRSILSLEDGNFILAGSSWRIYDTFGYHHSGQLMKITADGQVVWNRYYKTPGDTLMQWFYDVKATGDGGYIMVGEATDKFNPKIAPLQRGWIVKVDSNGCLGSNDPQCQSSSIAEAPEDGVEDFMVYPNPGGGFFRVEATLSEGKPLLVYDILGRKIFRKILTIGPTNLLVHTEEWPPGVYMITIGRRYVRWVKQ